MPQFAVSDREKVNLIEEASATPGTTPASPRWQGARFTGESLKSGISKEKSAEIVASRGVSALIPLALNAGGGLDFEWSYQENGFSALDLLLKGALAADWVLTAEKYNAGTADSAITDLAVTTGIITTTAVSPAWAVGMLIRATGFADALNNRVFRASAGSATSITPVTAGGAAEAAPGAQARVKCIGVQGAAGDLLAVTAGGNGITSTALNWTTFGLVVGQWVRPGTLAGGDAFSFVGTAANNGWCRISAITATKLSFDRVPAGWAADAAAGKTIRVFFGDYLRQGTVVKTYSVEKQNTDLSPVRYQVFKGMMVDQLSTTIPARKVLTGHVEFVGMTATPVSQTRTASSTDAAASVADPFSASSNVGTLYEAGVAVTADYLTQLDFAIANNGRQLPYVGSLGAAGVNMGEATITGTVKFWFRDETMYNKAINNVATSLALPVQDAAGNSMIFDFPNVQFNDADNAGGSKGNDVAASLPFTALTDPVLGYEMHVQRCELVGTAA